MELKELLKLADLNDTEQSRIISLGYRFPKVKEYAERFMSGDRSWESFEEAVKNTNSHITPEASKWALDILLVCHCYTYLHDYYSAKGYSDEMFKGAALDIMFKVRECVLVYGDIGTVSVTWYWGFFVMERFSFGRLQFGSSIHARDYYDQYQSGIYEKNGYKVERDMIVLDCHIPSGGPLTQEMCFDSYRRAREHFGYLWEDGIMRATCHTHLFYPSYYSLFGKNTQAFVDNFDVFHIEERDDFRDAWRFLDTNDISDLNALPCGTSVQRRFIEYMKNGGTHGIGVGYLLFDGEKIVNK